MYFEIGHFAAHLYREFHPLAQACGLQLRLRTSNRFVFADPLLLNRIVANLLSNAIRYGAREGVLLALRPRRGQLAIEVWDTGIGIAERDRADIFREFFQVGNTERDRAKGLGLGLAIVDRLVRLMNLTLEVRSKPGVGSMFRVLVPLGRKKKTVDRPAHSTALAEDRPGRYGLLVVVVDDERGVREATSALLTSWGCHVVTASLAEELGDPARDGRIPDLIIADLRLRDDSTGITAIQTLRSRFGQDIPGVIITGDTMPARLKQVRDSGLAVLHKPLHPEKLRELLGTLAASSTATTPATVEAQSHPTPGPEA